MIFEVIGIGNKKFEPGKKLLEIINQHQVFSGGERHYELVKHLLPIQHTWITIKGSLEKIFESYYQSNQSIVVFGSGDPLFYGMANTLITKFSDAEINTYPYFNSIQLI